MRKIGSLLAAGLLTASFAFASGCNKGGIDCDKLVNHLMDIGMKEVPEDGRDEAKKMFEGMKPELVKQCKAGKTQDGKAITQAMYDCAMKASTVADMQKCDTSGK